MPDRRRDPTVLAVLVLVCLVLITVDYRQGDGGPLGTVQRGAVAAFAPLQEAFHAAIQPIGGIAEGLGNLTRLAERNAALETELAELREGRTSVTALRRENRQLRAQLDMRERLGLETTGATVIAAAPQASSDWSVLLDAGAADGLEPGMPVINAEGLVGQLTQVTQDNARMRLLTSPRSGLVARVADTGETGLLRGRGNRPLRLELTNPDAEVSRDQEVVTRAFAGSAIPGGIPVGVIEELPNRNAAGSVYASVRPYVDFSQLRLVQVVMNGPGSPPELDEDERVTDPELPQPPDRDELEAPAPDAEPETGDGEGSADLDQASSPSDGVEDVARNDETGDGR